MRLNKTLLATAIAAVMTLGTIGSASAQTVWAHNHPHRVQINHRLEKQNTRIRTERRKGEISAHTAYLLHRHEHALRHQERHDASLHNGHLTRAEHHQLNRKENRAGHRIGH